VEPLFVEWQRITPCHHSRMMLTHLRNNRGAWQRRSAPQVASSSSPPPPPSGRRHSLPTSRDPAPRPRDRRYSAPHTASRLSMDGVVQLAAVAERGSTRSRGSDHTPSTPTAYLQYLVFLTDRRRLSLNTCSAHAQRTVVTPTRRSRSLVTPSYYLGNGVTPDVTSLRDTTWTPGWLSILAVVHSVVWYLSGNWMCISQCSAASPLSRLITDCLGLFLVIFKTRSQAVARIADRTASQKTI